ncbi:hypothetical protein NDU88_004638 [Pleurodeles waltl]|uniref:Uncharacterized protein n=1 Tax=Pleurodeles waltl TaxID=8319 RepID=A0AAV7MWZ1_PLEWA|nr:hypothetical protein NDU88_004638 [Pleurodeles waltl]
MNQNSCEMLPTLALLGQLCYEAASNPDPFNGSLIESLGGDVRLSRHWWRRSRRNHGERTPVPHRPRAVEAERIRTQGLFMRDGGHLHVIII